MTCIVGVAERGKVWMGADSLTVGGSIVYSRHEKLFRRGELLLGACGDARYGQLLAHAAEFIMPTADDNVSRYVATDLAKSIRKAVQEYGLMKQDAGQDHLESRVLIGLRGSLFNVDGVLSYVRIDEGYAAIGSGADVAMGSLYESQGRCPDPIDRLERALMAAEALTEYVRRPFIFDSL